MSTNEPEWSAIDAPLTPAQLAERVAMLHERDTVARAGDLPLWDRLASRSKSRLWSQMFWFGCWWGTLLLLAIALLRLLYHDGTTILVWFNAFTAYVYLPAYLVLVIALWKRRWILAALSAIVVGGHLAWIAPDFKSATPYPATNQSSETIRVFYANVLATNRDMQAVLEEIETYDPDVVVLVEYRQPRVPTMRAAPVMKQYRYGTDLRARYAGEVAVFSRLPVRRQQLTYAAGRLVNIVDIPVGSESLRIIALHNHRPLIEAPQLYYRFWETLDSIVADVTGPTIVIGDFNATQHSAAMDRLTSGRFRCAHADRGRGYASTWPNGLLPLPPIRIDHALLSPDVECVSIEEGTGIGSDHKPLVVDVRVHSPELAGRNRAERPAGTVASQNNNSAFPASAIAQRKK